MGFKAYGLGNVGFKPQSRKLRAYYGLGMWALEVLASDPSVEGIGIGS